MSLLKTLHSGAGSNAVELLALELRRSRRETPCKSGIKIDSDGNIYKMQSNGGWSNAGQWLLYGTASSFNVSRTIESGSLTVDAGAGPLALSADREYSISNTTWNTTKQAIITLTLDAGGGDLAEQQYVLSATLNRIDIDDTDHQIFPLFQASRQQ